MHVSENHGSWFSESIPEKEITRLMRLSPGGRSTCPLQALPECLKAMTKARWPEQYFLIAKICARHGAQASLADLEERGYVGPNLVRVRFLAALLKLSNFCAHCLRYRPSNCNDLPLHMHGMQKVWLRHSLIEDVLWGTGSLSVIVRVPPDYIRTPEHLGDRDMDDLFNQLLLREFQRVVSEVRPLLEPAGLILPEPKLVFRSSQCSDWGIIEPIIFKYCRKSFESSGEVASRVLRKMTLQLAGKPEEDRDEILNSIMDSLIKPILPTAQLPLHSLLIQAGIDIPGPRTEKAVCPSRLPETLEALNEQRVADFCKFRAEFGKTLSDWWKKEGRRKGEHKKHPRALLIFGYNKSVMAGLGVIDPEEPSCVKAVLAKSASLITPGIRRSLPIYVAECLSPQTKVLESQRTVSFLRAAGYVIIHVVKDASVPRLMSEDRGVVPGLHSSVGAEGTPPRIGMLLMGCKCVVYGEENTAQYFVNRSASRSVAQCARTNGIPLYVFAASFKYCLNNRLPKSDVPAFLPAYNRSAQVLYPVNEKVDAEMVTKWFPDVDIHELENRMQSLA